MSESNFTRWLTSWRDQKFSVAAPNAPTFLFDDLPLYWEMSRWEKYALASLLEVSRPAVAIEIGTYLGGSLQMFSRHARKVYSLDISPEPGAGLAGRFPNVEFLVGDSRSLLPRLLEDLFRRGEPLAFVLVDGDHTTAGVQADANALLSYQPATPLVMLFHDSFNPECRRGILAADWQASRHVHYFETDFVPGIYYGTKHGRAEAYSMWGGFALALSLPETRTRPLEILQTQRTQFEAAMSHSGYRRRVAVASLRRLLGRIKRKILRRNSDHR